MASLSSQISSQTSSASNYHMDINNDTISMDSIEQSSKGTSFLSPSGHSKHDDLKMMLESNRDGLKLEAMKRIIAMVAKGRNGDVPRELFANVVKNVVTKNAELKKLVYLYLTRYAEQEQDLALLSIATFQRSLKDPNPLIRACAIRVLSSIRVSMIAPIMLIAIKDCSNDMSPYVRKTAAHSIPKLYSLDPDLRIEIIDIIERLLNDKTSLVLGSAVAAFEEVCPERLDLIHQNYRKFCSLLVDVDEWGQVILINMLMRYARTQFLDPNRKTADPDDVPLIDSDHRMLLRSAKPLLQSRNSAVVLAVIQLYLSLAPNSDINTLIVKPLIRLLHSHREIQLVVLRTIATLTTIKPEDVTNEIIKNNEEKGNGDEPNHNDNDSDDDDDYKVFETVTKKSIKSLFEPCLKSLFIKSKDSTHVKILKLEILTNLSNSSNISLILREFQAYIMNYQDDLEFMSSTIQSIGHCASRIKEIAPVCLNGLITLLSNRNEAIVAQSIVVIRTQIMNKDEGIISMIIKQMTKLLEKITTPNARATILWILAEFCSKNEKALNASPDVLRQIAKTFCIESDIVKLQALNLAAKLYITCEDNDRLKLLVNYIFNLAKYDLNYDVRDRGRLLRQLLNDVTLARAVLMAPKLIPNIGKRMASGSANYSRYRIGTMSHFLGKEVNSYEELPDWPEVQPDPSVRLKADVIEEPTFALIKKDVYVKKKRDKKQNGFYSSDDSSDEDDSGDEDEDEDDSSEVENEESEEESGTESESEDETSDADEESDDDDDDEEEEDEDDESETESESSEEVKPQVKKNAPVIKVVPQPKTKVPETIAKVKEKKESAQNTKEIKSKETKNTNSQSIDLLLDFGGDIPMETNAPVFIPPMGSISMPQPVASSGPYRIMETAEMIPTVTYELFNIIKKFSIIYRFPRMREGNQTLVELIINNESDDTIKLRGGKNIEFKGFQGNEQCFKLSNGEVKLLTLGVDFNESPSQGIEITINDTFTVKIIAPTGEIFTPVKFNTIEYFKTEQSKLRGMNEVNEKINLKSEISDDAIIGAVLKAANLGTNKFEDNVLRFAGATLKVKSLVLITIERDGLLIKQTVNCEKMLIGSMISKIIKDSILKL